jgi:hypothetical protein
MSRWMTVTCGEIISANNGATERIVFTFTAAIGIWLGHPGDAATWLEGKIRTMAV